MSSARGTRKLSTAFDNFRSKVRKTRIDSLLSPPRLDSGSSESPSDWGGVPLDEEAYTSTAGSKKGLKGRTAEHVEFALPSETDDATAEESDAEAECVENRRIAAALGDFRTEKTESYDVDEDVGSFFRTGHPTTLGGEDEVYGPPPRDEGSLSSIPGSFLGGLSDTSTATVTSSGATEDRFDIGAPLERQGPRCGGHSLTQIQTEPQTAEQCAAQTTFASLDEILERPTSDWFLPPPQPLPQPLPRQPLRIQTTVDGLRLDAQPLTRHTGTSAPPQTKMLGSPAAAAVQRKQQQQQRDGRLGIDNYLGMGINEWGFPSDPYTSSLRTTAAAAASGGEGSGPPVVRVERPSLLDFDTESSSTSEVSCTEYFGSERMNASRRPGFTTQQRPQTTNLSRPIRPQLVSQTYTNSQQHHHHHVDPTVTSTAAAPQTQPLVFPQPPAAVYTVPYSHTPPIAPQQQQQQRQPPIPSLLPPSTYTSLHSPQTITQFHTALCARLHNKISNGDIHPCQIPVKERVRRLSTSSAAGRIMMGRGGVVVRRTSRGVGDAVAWAGEGVLNSGAVGQGWGSVAEVAEREGRGFGEVGAAAGLAFYGGGFL